MSRKMSTIDPQWWDYTTLDRTILEDAAKITVKDIEQLQRPGFKVTIFDSIEEFFVAEAMEYIRVWQESTPGLIMYFQYTELRFNTRLIQVISL